MKHTPHHDPFDYDAYQDNSFWDFSFKNDWPIVAGVAVAILVAGFIFLI